MLCPGRGAKGKQMRCAERKHAQPKRRIPFSPPNKKGIRKNAFFIWLCIWRRFEATACTAGKIAPVERF